MLAEALRTVYGYNQWATGRLLDAADRLSPEQLHAPGTAGRGSVRDTLLHLLDTQRSWLAWWDGSLPPEQAYSQRLDPADYPDLPSMRALWEALEERTQAFLATLSDADAARVYRSTLPNGQEWSMVLWQMMLHVANHGTQHRAEVAAMLTDVGQSPGDLDLLFYLPRQAATE